MPKLVLHTLIALIVLAVTGAQAAGAPAAVTRLPWQEAMVSVTDIDRGARFCVEIGGYVGKWRALCIQPG